MNKIVLAALCLMALTACPDRNNPNFTGTYRGQARVFLDEIPYTLNLVLTLSDTNRGLSGTLTGSFPGNTPFDLSGRTLTVSGNKIAGYAQLDVVSPNPNCTLGGFPLTGPYSSASVLTFSGISPAGRVSCDGGPTVSVRSDPFTLNR